MWIYTHIISVSDIIVMHIIWTIRICIFYMLDIKIHNIVNYKISCTKHFNIILHCLRFLSSFSQHSSHHPTSSLPHCFHLDKIIIDLIFCWDSYSYPLSSSLLFLGISHMRNYSVFDFILLTNFPQHDILSMILTWNNNKCYHEISLQMK